MNRRVVIHLTAREAETVLAVLDHECLNAEACDATGRAHVKRVATVALRIYEEAKTERVPISAMAILNHP